MPYFIGIDLGGTKIEGILADEKGKIYARERTPTEAKKGRNVVVKNIISIINKLKKNKRIKAVGICTPGFVQTNGTLASVPNIPSFMNFNLKKELKKRIREKIVIENDANCFALAESHFGAGKKTNHMIGVIFGTGLGFGIIINKKIYHGFHGGAGEFHNSWWSPGGPYDFEFFCSGPAIAKNYKKMTGKTKSTKEIFKSKDAKKVLDKMYEHFALVLSYIVNLLNPELIVVGGGVSNSLNYTILNKELKKFAYLPLMKNVKVVKHKLGDSAGVLGAVALVR